MNPTTSTTLTKPAIFLDRDGVIIHNRANYVRSWAQVKFYPYSLAAIQRLSQHFWMFIITNQSAIGRGLLDEQTLLQINARLKSKIKDAGGRMDRIYYCPHAPAASCTCRKPQPGLIRQALADYPVDLAASWLIGDAISDIQAGLNAGIPNNILLQTGRGKKQLQNSPPDLNFFVETNFNTAARKILATSTRRVKYII